MKNPLEVIEKNDKELFAAIDSNRKLAFADGALSAKYKLLIGLALDAVQGKVGGINSLAKAALDAGANKEEIFETLRVAYFIGGVVTSFDAAYGLEDIF